MSHINTGNNSGYQTIGAQLSLVKLTLVVALMMLTGCQSISYTEYEDFQPMPKAQRVISNVNLTWDVRPDAADYCAKLKENKGNAMMGAPIACAIWSAKAQTCTIVTSPNPNHVVIGHEVRHCFEGHFHP